MNQVISILLLNLYLYQKSRVLIVNIANLMVNLKHQIENISIGSVLYEMGKC